MAEYALVAARRSKLAAMAARGDRGAKRALRAVADLDRSISAAQLGIVLASLAVGWLGAPLLTAMVGRLVTRTGASVLSGPTSGAAGAVAAFVIIAVVHVVLGGLAPRALALAMPERISGVVALPLLVFARLMSPLIRLLNGATAWLLRLAGVSPMSEARRGHSPEEIRLLVMQARAVGTLNETDSAMLAGIFDFANKRVEDVMRPRTDVVALHIDDAEDQVTATVRRERYSRYPVYGESLDDIVGVFLSKDLWLRDRARPFALRDVLREPLLVPATRSAERVLDDLRRTRAQMAVVLDEFGGTAGIVTMEDLIEEVIGDISDEYDLASRDVVDVDGVLELTGSMSLVDVRSDHRLPIPDGEWTTLGGYVFATLGHVPRLGERAAYPGGELEVIAMDKRRVAAVRVHRSANTP